MTGYLTAYSLEVILPAIGWTLLHSLWQITLIGLVVYIIKKLIPNHEHRWQYRLSMLALISFLLVTVSSFYGTFDVLAYDFACCNTMSSISECNTTEIGCAPLINGDDGLIQNIQSISDFNIHLISFFWLLGFLFLMTRWGAAYFYTHKISSRSIAVVDDKVLKLLNELKDKMGMHIHIGLRESFQVSSPMVLGILKPIILFPVGIVNQLEMSEIEAILAHELAHIQRFDFSFNLIQTIVEAIFYYHPIVWLFAKFANDEREICCDEIAVDIINNHHLYARTLVKLQEIGQGGFSLGMRFSGPECQLKRRVLMILNQPLGKGGIQDKLIASLSFAALIFGFNFYGDHALNEINCLAEINDSFCLEESLDAPNCQDEVLLLEAFVEDILNTESDLNPSVCKTSDLALVPKSITVVDLSNRKKNKCVCPLKKKQTPQLRINNDYNEIIKVTTIANAYPQLKIAQRCMSRDTVDPSNSKFYYYDTKSTAIANSDDVSIKSQSCTKGNCMKVSEIRIENKYKKIHLEDDYVNIKINKSEEDDKAPINLDLNDDKMFTLIKALRNDGLIGLLDKVVKLNMTYEKLTINGEEQDKTTHDKYKVFYAENLDIPIQEGSKIIFKYKS